MGSASIEVSGYDAGRQAAGLHIVLTEALTAEGMPGAVGPVEVERSADLVVAVIGLVFGGVGAAKTIWDWWESHRSSGVRVRIVLEDGSQVELSGVDQQGLEIAFERQAGGDA